MARTEDLLNSWIPFYSPKFVRVFNWRLGFLRLLFILGIILYAVIYTMLYSGDHLLRLRVTGTASVRAFPPRLMHCQIFDQNCDAMKSRLDLAYCENSNLPALEKRPCRYLDDYEVNRVDMGLGNLFVPLRIVEYSRLRVDDGSASRKRVQKMNELASFTTSGVENKDFFVADIERYHVHIMHSAIAPSGKLSWELSQMKGYYTGPDGIVRSMGCRKDDPLPGCQQINNASWYSWWSSSPSPGQTEPKHVSIPKRRLHWDAMSIRTLVRLSNQSLDDRWKNKRKTKRSCGFTLWINIIYTNTESWAGLKITPWSTITPRYTYAVRVTEKQDCTRRRITTNSDQWRFKVGSKREEAKLYGIKIMAKPAGEVLVWNTMQTLIVMSTSMAAVTTACLVLDYLLEYLTHWFEVIKYDTHEAQHLNDDLVASGTSKPSVSTTGP